VVHVGLGANDKAFEYLERAYEERSGSLIYLKVEPILDPLRSDPRFQDLVRRVGLPPWKTDGEKRAQLPPPIGKTISHYQIFQSL
jgi:hypothetical protein